MIKKIEGIVVSTVDYRENSKIVNILTKEDGVVGVFARGSKKIKSNLLATSSILTYGIFHLNKTTKKMPNLIEVDIIDYFKKIRTNLGKMAYATYLLELSSQVYRHDQSNNIYKLLIAALKKINEGYDFIIITNIVELKMLEYLGIKPVIDKCVNCGNSDEIVTISSYRGGYLCKNCVSSEQIFNLKTLKLIRMFYYINIDKISKIDVSNNIKRELNIFINDYYDRYSGLYLKTRDFLEKYSMLVSNN